MRVALSANLAGVLRQPRSERKLRELVCPVFRTRQTWAYIPAGDLGLLPTEEVYHTWYIHGNSSVPFAGLDKSGWTQESHFQLAYCSRRAVFLNLPTEVRGM